MKGGKKESEPEPRYVPLTSVYVLLKFHREREINFLKCLKGSLWGR